MAKGTSNRLIFQDAELARDTITATQKREIAKLYDEWADEIGERAKYYARKTIAKHTTTTTFHPSKNKLPKTQKNSEFINSLKRPRKKHYVQSFG